MKTISLPQLRQCNPQIKNLLVYPESWTKYCTYERYKNAPRPSSGLFIICTDIQALFYEKDQPPVIGSQGDVIFIPHGVHYHAEIPEGRSNLIDTYTLNFLLLDGYGEELLLSDHIAIIANRQDDLLTAHAAAVSSAFHQADQRNDLRLSAALYQLLDGICVSAEDQSTAYYPIQPGIDLLRKEWNQNRRIEEYAALCGMCPANFYRCFRRWCGKSPVQYRNEVRLNHAQTMLRNTDVQINEIARTVGFTDAFYFCRLFAKEYGLSPRKYRTTFQRG